MLHDAILFLGAFFIVIGFVKATCALVLYWKERRKH